MTRIVLYSLLGLVLGQAGITWDNVNFWLIFTLMFAIEHMAKISLVEEAIKEFNELKKQDATKNNDGSGN